MTDSAKKIKIERKEYFIFQIIILKLFCNKRGKMKKTNSVIVSLFLVFTLVFSSCAKQDVSKTSKMHVIFAGTEAATTGQSRMMQAAAEKLNATGHFNATVMVAGSLSGDTEALMEQAKAGYNLVVPSDPGRIASAFNIPDLNILMAPYILTDPALLEKLPDTELFKEWQAQLEKQGIIYITNMYNGFRSFYTTKPVKTVADLEGLRIRGFGNAIGKNLAKYLGFENMGIAWSSVYPEIHQNTLDGCEVQVATADGSHIYEVTKYLAMTKHYMLQSAFICSANFYNNLSEEDRDIFVKIIRECAVEYGKIIEEEEDGFYSNMRKNGVNISDVDINEFKNAIEPMYQTNALGFTPGLKDRLFKELGQ